jgi:hypothetical protein
LNRSTQLTSSLDEQEGIINRWRLDDGFHSFLIDRQGTIVAVDPDVKTLAALK